MLNLPNLTNLTKPTNLLLTVQVAAQASIAARRPPPLARWISRLACAALLAGCTSTSVAPPEVPAATAPGQLAIIDYQGAAAQGQRVMRIDPARSIITIIVRRGGTLARLGHDHVVASRSVTGYVAPALGRADFQFRLDQMTVDEPALRSAAGFDTQPTPEAISGTRVNMLTKVLDAERFPLAVIGVARAAGSDVLDLQISLHGVTRALRVPVQISDSGAQLTAKGSVLLKQSDFGITPFAVLGGAMAVQDQMELAFSLLATAAHQVGQ